MAPNMSLFSVNAILLLSADDNSRILTKYYSPPHPPANAGNNFPGANPYPTLKDQKAFEKGLLEKTAKSTNDVILYDNRIVVYKTESDVMLYVVGPADENEIMLYSVVLALRDSLNILLKCVNPTQIILTLELMRMFLAGTPSTNARSSRTTTLPLSPSTRSLTTASSSKPTLSLSPAESRARLPRTRRTCRASILVKRVC